MRRQTIPLLGGLWDRSKLFFLQYQWLLTSITGLLTLVIFYDVFRKLFDAPTTWVEHEHHLNTTYPQSIAIPNQQTMTLFPYEALYSPLFLLVKFINNLGPLGAFAQATPIYPTVEHPLLPIAVMMNASEQFVLYQNGTRALLMNQVGKNLTIQMLNLTNPLTPHIISTYNQTTIYVPPSNIEKTYAVIVNRNGTLAFVASSVVGLKILNLSTTTPTLVYSTYSAGRFDAYDLVLSEDEKNLYLVSKISLIVLDLLNFRQTELNNVGYAGSGGTYCFAANIERVDNLLTLASSRYVCKSQNMVGSTYSNIVRFNVTNASHPTIIDQRIWIYINQLECYPSTTSFAYSLISDSWLASADLALVTVMNPCNYSYDVSTGSTPRYPLLTPGLNIINLSNTSTATPLTVLATLNMSSATAFSLSPDQQLALVVNKNRLVYVVDVAQMAQGVTPTVKARLDLEKDVRTVTFSPDAQFVYVTTATSLQIFLLRNSLELPVVSAFPNIPQYPAFAIMPQQLNVPYPPLQAGSPNSGVIAFFNQTNGTQIVTRPTIQRVEMLDGAGAAQPLPDWFTLDGYRFYATPPLAMAGHAFYLRLWLNNDDQVAYADVLFPGLMPNHTLKRNHTNSSSHSITPTSTQRSSTLSRPTLTQTTRAHTLSQSTHTIRRSLSSSPTFFSSKVPNVSPRARSKTARPLISPFTKTPTPEQPVRPAQPSTVLEQLLSPELAAAVETSVTASTAISGILSPASANKATTMSRITAVTKCEYVSDEADFNPLLYIPSLPLSLGGNDPNAAMMNGAILSTTGLLGLTFAVFLASGYLQHKTSSDLARKLHKNVSVLFALMMSYYGPNVIEAATLSTSHFSAPDKALALAAFTCWGTAFAWTLFQVHRKTSEDNPSASKFWLSPFYEPGRDFDHKIIRALVFTDMAIAYSMAVLSGIKPEARSCQYIALSMVIVSIANLAYLLKYRPYKMKLEQALIIINALLQLALSALSLGTTFNRQLLNPLAIVEVVSYGVLYVQVALLTIEEIIAQYKNRCHPHTTIDEHHELDSQVLITPSETTLTQQLTPEDTLSRGDTPPGKATLSRETSLSNRLIIPPRIPNPLNDAELSENSYHRAAF